MMNDFFRRNTKKSTEEECKLPELREKVIWLRFTHTERMMYNAYLTDPNVNRFSQIVRQICCHPKIADEIKGVLSNCKTLEDIERSMVSHYKNQYEYANYKMKRCERYIAKTERRILIAEYKRQRRFLKQKGYRVMIELPHFDQQIDRDLKMEGERFNNLNGADEAEQVVDKDDELDNDNFNLDGSDTDDDDEHKPLMTINEQNQKAIKDIIRHQHNSNPSQVIDSMRDNLVKQNERLVVAKKVCAGKKSSFDFFNNMLERIKKTTERSKLKYEKMMLKDKKEKMKEADSDNVDADDDQPVTTDDEDDDDNCGICMCPISGEDVGVTKCGHLFCYDCLKTSINSTGKCPMCNTPHKSTDISMISFEKPVFNKENSEILKNKLELINNVGTKLTNLIYYLNSIPDHVIIFSQWDSLLRKVGETLSEHGIKNVFCRGNVWARDKALREFNSDDRIKVIMLSSESSASGANLTKASKVILLDPVSGSYEQRRNTEWQAIGRAYRLGQKKSVEIVRFIIKDTVEEEIYRENKIEDAKQKVKLNISEVTDETITLSDDGLRTISEAISRAKKEKDEKLKMLKEKLIVKKEMKEKNKNIAGLKKKEDQGKRKVLKVEKNK